MLYIDLDSHPGNGVKRVFREDRNVAIFDVYNRDICPRDHKAMRRIDYDLPLASGVGDRAYRSRLKGLLPQILKDTSFRLPIYNAGRDVFEGDRLGGLALTEAGVFERDRFALDTLADHQVPCVMVPSGGYNRDSYRLITNRVMGRLRAQVSGKN